MKVFLVDDQKAHVATVLHALEQISDRIQVSLEFEHIRPGAPGETRLAFEPDGTPRVGPTVDEGVKFADVERMKEARRDSLYLLDVRFPNDDRYGFWLAEHLVRQHGIARERIVLFTMFPDQVGRAETAEPGEPPWFTFFDKSKFSLPHAHQRLGLEIQGSVEAIASRGRAAQTLPERWGGIVGKSPKLLEVLEVARRAAATSASVLITGESGTGKELLARAVHDASPRSKGPLVNVSCAVGPETLWEAEFFGHVKGAFTGANSERAGRFEEASGGTLFLDELGELSLQLQTKLLRVLDESKVRRLGGKTDTDVDVRLVCATNRDLPQMVGNGTFRQDLFYRVNVVELHLPPLRERPEDIEDLAAELLSQNASTSPPRRHLSPDALAALRAHDWPGNIRELKNVLENACIRSRDRTIRSGALLIKSLAPQESNTGEVLAPPPSDTRRPPARPSGRAAAFLQSSWTAHYSELGTLTGEQPRAGRQDRRLFQKVLRLASAENEVGPFTDCVRLLLHALHNEGRSLPNRFRRYEPQQRYLAYVLGTLMQIVPNGEGRTFLLESCGLQLTVVEKQLASLRRGDGVDEVERSWSRLAAEKGDADILIGVLVRQIRELVRETEGAGGE